MHQIMEVQSGVTLDCLGIKKAGMNIGNQRMSRKEYCELVEKETAVKKVQSKKDDGSSKDKDSRPVSPEKPEREAVPVEAVDQDVLGEAPPDKRSDQPKMQVKPYPAVAGFGAHRPSTAPAPISTGATPNAAAMGGAALMAAAAAKEPPASEGAVRPRLPSAGGRACSRHCPRPSRSAPGSPMRR